MGRNLTNLYISESFNHLLQISGSDIQNGLGVAVTGSLASPINITVVSASYAVSASVEITKEVSSSYADFAQVAGIATSSLNSVYTASVVDSTITFTKGDGSTFDITVAQSGSVASASYATYAESAGTALTATSATTSQYSDNTIVTGKNVSGAPIAKGTPLYFTGSGTSGNLVGVWPADAGLPSRMPAGGVAGEAIAAGAEGVVLLDGFINGVDTSAFASGDIVYVAVGGGYTNQRPTGSNGGGAPNKVQELGYVEKVNSSNGSGVIKGPGIANDIPNVLPGYTFVGDANYVPQPTAVSSLSVASAVSSSYAVTSSHATTIPDDITVRTIDVKGDGTIGVPDIKVSGSISLGGVSNPFIILRGNTDNGTTTVNHTSWTVSTANQAAKAEGGSEFDGYIGTNYQGQYTVLVGNYPSWGSGTWQGPAISNDIDGNYDAVIGFQPAGAADNRVTILTPLSASAGITGNLTGNASTATSASHALVADAINDANVAYINQNNIFTGTQTFDNIAVNGTGSFAYIQSITGSAKIIGDAYIILNNNLPAERYAGIVVQDSGSGSPLTTASLEFDGQTNDWFYEYSNDGGTTTDHGVVIFGPEYSTKGSPTYLTSNALPKSSGSHHIVDSNISDDGSAVKINSDTQITGSLIVSSSLTVNGVTSDGSKKVSIVDDNGYEVVKVEGLLANKRETSLFVSGGIELNLPTFFSRVNIKGNAGTTTQNGGNITVADAAGTYSANINGGNGGVISVNQNSANEDFGLAGQMQEWGYLGDWTGPGIYTNDSGGNYPTIIGFQNASNYTDGRVTFLTPLYSNVKMIVSSSTGFPIDVDGTMDVKRLHFSKNPFNTLENGTLGAIRMDGTNKSFYSTLYNDTYNQSSQSKFICDLDTTSSFSATRLEADYGGTQGSFEVRNDNGTRTAKLITDSYIITGSVRGEVNALSIASTTASLNAATGNFFTLALVDGADTHVDASNIKPGQTYILRSTNGASGTGTISFAPEFKFAGGTPPTGSAGASAVDVFTFVSFDSTNVFATAVENLS